MYQDAVNICAVLGVDFHGCRKGQGEQQTRLTTLVEGELSLMHREPLQVARIIFGSLLSYSWFFSRL